MPVSYQDAQDTTLSKRSTQTPETPAATAGEPDDHASSLINMTKALTEQMPEAALDPVAQILVDHTIRSACTSISLQLEQEKCLHRMETLNQEICDAIEEMEQRLLQLRRSLKGLPVPESLPKSEHTEIFDVLDSLEKWTKQVRRRQTQPAASPSRTTAIKQYSPSNRAAHPTPPSLKDKADPQQSSQIAPSLDIYLFGGLEVVENGASISRWPKDKAKQIFKYLAITGHPVQKEVLMEMFWPHHSTESARNNLNVTIYSLRKTLDMGKSKTPLIVYHDGKYQFNPATQVRVDTREFDRLHRQLLQKTNRQLSPEPELSHLVKVYRGDLFSDDLYCEWASELRETYREKFLTALRTAARYHLEHQENEACINSCLRLVNLDNCDEGACQILMSCYSQTGQRHLALKQYDSLEKSLRAELNLSPSQATEELLARIRNSAGEQYELHTG
ncbi:MAG: AfsR/SARP family transcriptional regulator [bacterium]